MKKFLTYLFVALFIVINMPQVDAKVKLNDYFKSGDNLIVDKKINGSIFYAGNNINLNSKIDGVAFLAGNNLNIQKSGDYTFLAGNDIVYKGKDGKDIFAAGNIIKLENGEIKRDVYIIGSNVTVDANIGRNINIAANVVNINGTINGDVNLSADTINISKNAVIKGILNYNDNAQIKIANKNKIKTATYHINNDQQTIYSKLIDIFISFLTALFTALILSFVIKNSFKKLDKTKIGEIPKFIAQGFIGLIIIPIIALLLLFTTIGLPISLILIALYLISLYIAKIFVAYLVGNYILNNKDKSSIQLKMLIGLVILYLIKLVPILGSIISMLVAFAGFGIILKIIKKEKA